MADILTPPGTTDTTPRRGPLSGSAITYEQLAGAEHAFWSRVAVGDDSDCWPREGSGNSYQRFRMRRIAPSPLLAHRVAFVFMIDDIPAGMTVDHTCCNPACCNPSHLQLVTAAENIRLRSSRRDTGMCPAGHRTELSSRGKNICRECARAAARRSNQLPVTSHGLTGYKRGCRCELCRDAKRAGNARRKSRAAWTDAVPPLTDAAPAPRREPSTAEWRARCLLAASLVNHRRAPDGSLSAADAEVAAGALLGRCG